MTLDRADNRSKDLGESELQIIAPPTFSDTQGESDAEISSDYPHKVIVNIVRQLLEMASDDRELTSIDKDTLSDVLRYGNVTKVAELHHLPLSTVSTRLQGAFHRLTRQMTVWQNDKQQIAQLHQQLSQQQAAARAMMSDIEAQEAEMKRLRAENEQLRLQLDQAGDSLHKPKLTLRKLTPLLKKRLARDLEKVAFPIDIVRQLNDHSIFKVSDLIQQSETDLSQLDGLTPDSIEKIKDHLHFMRFQLNTDIIYVEALDDYYLKEKL